MGTLRLKRKTYTVYDKTDRLKAMKDSDILAEKKEAKPGYGGVATSALSGAAAGGLILGTAGTVKGLATGSGFGGRLSSAGRSLKRGGKWGAIAGGIIGAAMANKARHKKSKDNKFYNDRLEYAQRQARRREKKDWKTNMTQRDGYSY